MRLIHYLPFLSIIYSIQDYNELTAASNKVVLGYYVPWGRLEPEALSWNKLTHINYGFALLTKKDPVNPTVDRYYDGTRIRKLQKLGKEKNVKILMTIGGWTGGQTFSKIAKDAELRKQFINNTLTFVRVNTKPEYDEHPDGWGLDGIDLDWEYPARNGAACNIVDPLDSQNFLVLLKELRQALDTEFPKERKLLTAAVRVQPFDGPNKLPMTNVKEFSKYFDFINIMAYDINGGWSSTTGPNAPTFLNKAQADPYSLKQSIQDWTDAGFPKEQLVAGLPFYGRSQIATTDMSKNPSLQFAPKTSEVPKGDPSDANEPNMICNEGSVYSGVWKYKYLRSMILVKDPITPSDGYIRYFDNTTQTPWLFRPSDKRYISYDDPISLQVKVDLVRYSGLRGVMFWDLSHDANDELLNFIISS
ncbi:glycoside hydrolase family 18 protein [Conidiobolus coronatus NRRL 28638]|uniref:Glycoside hydrolase family 18 protein n=1 Tax=Conidiobolus coronatus (strain ATCC 28846 / CBS 209.66 / NRRL 28638) TaxID=796925 RepID=A0A137P8J4_CONC2|nr:glycoside hydrolase family 18 protein [Conidiobolus coronatus NRRL 28638]|eukprot:KXN71328.1 glycoside hydrolase family 18 protein [Conidiobolus coronatus NRRL 28638]